MAGSDTLRTELAAIEAELDGLGDRRKALEKAAADLRSAIASMDALDGTSGGASPERTKRKNASSSTPKSKRPTVTPDDLVGALRDLGGTGTVEQLVEKLGLPDGRSLNGARRVAVDDGLVTYEDRTYALVDSSTKD